LVRRLGGAPSRCGHFEEDMNLLTLPGIEAAFCDYPASNVEERENRKRRERMWRSRKKRRSKGD
jgi:hypothetical protein